MADDKMEKFDLVGKVQERMQGTIAELIPEAQWKELIAREIEAFIQGPRKRNYNNQLTDERLDPKARPIVEAELTKFFLEKVRGVIQSPEWQSEQAGKVGPLLAKIISDAAPSILVTILTGGLHSALANMQSNFQFQASKIADLESKQHR